MIGGNLQATIEKKKVVKDSLGDDTTTWNAYKVLTGFLDLMEGQASYGTYNAKIQSSSHVFICDYQEIDVEEAECRLKINDKIYEVKLIDNPMELNKHLEIYLSYVGS